MWTPRPSLCLIHYVPLVLTRSLATTPNRDTAVAIILHLATAPCSQPGLSNKPLPRSTHDHNDRAAAALHAAYLSSVNVPERDWMRIGCVWYCSAALQKMVLRRTPHMFEYFHVKAR